MRTAEDLRQPAMLAMACTFTMLAHQVAGKAARDGFFLLEYAPSDLPKIVVTAAMLSIGFSLLFSRFLERLGPARLIPKLFAFSAALHLGEWALVPTIPRAIVILIYLHIVGLGAILLSGFWSLLSEVFDPREAKVRFGRIAGFGTAGGIAGGVVAERLVALTTTNSLLLLLALLHIVCAAFSYAVTPNAPRMVRSKSAPAVSVRAAFARTPLLWRLAALVFAGTCSAALLDYLFKLGATMMIGKGPALVRYFAIYYTGCQVLTFLIQVAFSRWILERAGIARSVASLPLSVGAFSALALLIPVYPLVVVARAVEVIFRGSIFRSGYELLYAPVPASDKRSVKTIVDVGCDRFGDAVGAGAVQLMVWLGPTLARPEILGLAILLSVLSAMLALRLGSSYRDVLEAGLVRRAREESDGRPLDESMMNTMFEGLPSLTSLRAIRARDTPVAKLPDSGEVKAAPRPADCAVNLIAELRSQDLHTVRRALKEPFEPLAVPQVIRLLAWDEASAAARQYLERGGERIAGQLTDALADPDVDFGIRRRIPRLLARLNSPAAVDGLILGLHDPRFEVRFQCGRSLEYMRRHRAEMGIRESQIFEVVNRELSVSKTIWSSWRILDRRDSADDYNFLDEVLRERADQSLEHVFSLLAVVLPREPLMASFRALHQTDRMFRGLALEYLENILPDDIRTKLWMILEESPASPPASDAEKQKVLEELLVSDAKLVLKLKELRESSGDEEPAGV